MMKKEKIVWRLGKLPTTEELRELVKDKIITNEEAREILFKTETEEEIDTDSLKSEIKFLRELVSKLSENKNSQIVEYIHKIEQPYIPHRWFKQYDIWCLAGDNAQALGTGQTYAFGSNTATTNKSYTYISTSNDFTNIETF